MPALPKILDWYTLTEMVNEFKNPSAFLTRMVFGNSRELTTENIVYRIQRKGRNVAPFVLRNGEAIMSGGYDEEEVNFQAPNIRLKRPLEAADLIFRRHAGDVIFAGGGTVDNAAEREVALQMQTLDDEISNAEEYLAAFAIQGVVTYTVADEAAFTIDMKKPAGNTIDLGAGNYWDEANVNPITDIKLARRTMHDEVTLNPTICVLGSEACDAFLDNTEVQRLLDTRNLRVGVVDFTQDINELGAMPLGNFGGIDFWAYTRQLDVNTVLTDLIRPKYAEFISTSPQAQHIRFYGAHSDLDALETNRLASRRFSKSWRQNDPSVQQILLASRPLPVMRRPGAVVSMKVVSG